MQLTITIEAPDDLSALEQQIYASRARTFLRGQLDQRAARLARLAQQAQAAQRAEAATARLYAPEKTL